MVGCDVSSLATKDKKQEYEGGFHGLEKEPKGGDLDKTPSLNDYSDNAAR